ncbi:MAG: hypothetical protein IJ981_03110 [Clostridia bacterium]|nr:hypothetical protein [Clostridia bacterium]
MENRKMVIQQGAKAQRKLLYQLQKQKTESKNSLNCSDYKSIKAAEKMLLLLAERFLLENNPSLVEDFLLLVTERQNQRDEINRIEEQIAQMRNQQGDEK